MKRDKVTHYSKSLAFAGRWSFALCGAGVKVPDLRDTNKIEEVTCRNCLRHKLLKDLK